MAGKGAPHGNNYAAKEGTGKTISLYLSGDDRTIIHQILQDRGEDASDEACVRLAKQAAKSGIYQLLIAKKSENKQSLEAALRGTIDKLFAMVYREQKESKKMFNKEMYYIEPSDVQSNKWNVKSVQGESIWTDEPYDDCFYRIYGTYPSDIPQMQQAMQEKLDALRESQS